MYKTFIVAAKEFWRNEDGFIALASLALTAAGLGTSLFGGFAAGAAQDKLAEAKAQQDKIATARARTRQIRAGRAARAQVLQAGENQGAAESSSVKAGAAGAMGQAFQNIQDINYQESAGQAQGALQQGIRSAQGVQSLGEGISSLGGTIFNNQAEIKDIFGIPNK